MENALYEMYEILSEYAEDATHKLKKLKGSNENLNINDLDYVDKLTHAVKSVKSTLVMCEAEKDGGSSYGDRSIEPGRDRAYRSYANDGESYANDGGSYGSGMSGRRGRSSVTGRFVSRASGYSGHGDEAEVMDMVRDAMERDPEGTRRKLEQMIGR